MCQLQDYEGGIQDSGTRTLPNDEAYTNRGDNESQPRRTAMLIVACAYN